MENYIISIILGILSSFLIVLLRRNYKNQDEKLKITLSNIQKQFKIFQQLLLFLKIQNTAQNAALSIEFKNNYTKNYDKELTKLMEQEDFKQVG